MEQQKITQSHPTKDEFLSIHPPLATRRAIGFNELPLFIVLKVLEGKDKRTIRNCLAATLDVDLRRWQDPDIKEKVDLLRANPKWVWYAASKMISTMRLLARMWIDSGKSRTDRDIDNPAARNVEDVLPGQQVSLFFLINQNLLIYYPRYMAMRRDGTQAPKGGFPRFNSEDLVRLGIERSLEGYGVQVAMYYFAELLDSPYYSQRLSRCDYCKCYFADCRTRLRPVNHGVNCSSCPGKSSAKRTVISRAKRLDTGAKAWIEYHSKRRTTEQWKWISGQVNEAHGTAFGRRWVSQNLPKILKRVEALSSNGKA